ncbi:DUF115 domain-containing protein [Sulfurimonas sp.]|nr:DUF115 domain-containing protein [Sulfurimonas sp.]
MDIYNKNLDALSKVDSKLASILRLTTTNEIFEVYLPENENPDEANIVDMRDSTFIYEKSSSLEIKTKLKEFEQYDSYPILYFFGFGNGSFFQKLLENDKHQQLIIIEPEIELIYIVLNLIDFSKDILLKRMVIKLSVLIDKAYFINELSATKKFFVKGYNLHIYSNFYDKYMLEIERVNKTIVEAFKFSMYIIGNSAKDALIGLEYSLKNIPQMITTPQLRGYLSKKAKNTKIAVIVSTGPSLSKQLKLLKKMQQYISILCIDASFPILAKAGIKPDIVFSIERVSLTSKFYKETEKSFHKDVIFSLATVCHDETISNIHGKKCFFMRADSYNVFFGLDDWGYMGGGQSAANFAYDFAVKAEFETIVFIGQDLAYAKDGRSHSKNHVFGEDEITSTKIVGRVEAYGGDGEVNTTEIWKAFSNAFSVQIANSKILTINATEGGARIHGTIELNFEDVIEKYTNRSIRKESIHLENPSQELISLNLKQFKDKVNIAISIGENMRENSEKLYIKIDKLLKDIDDDLYLQGNIVEKVNSLMDDIKDIKIEYNDKNFADFYGSLLLGYIANHEYEIANVYMMREHNNKAKNLKKVEWLKVHHEWLYRLCINLDEIIKLLKKSSQ